jgi:hypothetical protein
MLHPQINFGAFRRFVLTSGDFVLVIRQKAMSQHLHSLPETRSKYQIIYSSCNMLSLLLYLALLSLGTGCARLFWLYSITCNNTIHN